MPNITERWTPSEQSRAALNMQYVSDYAKRYGVKNPDCSGLMQSGQGKSITEEWLPSEQSQAALNMKYTEDYANRYSSNRYSSKSSCNSNSVMSNRSCYSGNALIARQQFVHQYATEAEFNYVKEHFPHAIVVIDGKEQINTLELNHDEKLELLKYGIHARTEAEYILDKPPLRVKFGNAFLMTIGTAAILFFMYEVIKFGLRLFDPSF